MESDKVFTFIKSKAFLGIIAGLAALVVLVSVFSAGMAVGYRRARFSYAWGENYQQNFAGPKTGFFHDMTGRDFIDAHGTAGEIIKTGGPNIVVKGRDGVERTITVDADTSVVRLHDTIGVGDLKAGQTIVTIGEPSGDGQIQAKLLRVMPMH